MRAGTAPSAAVSSEARHCGVAYLSGSLGHDVTLDLVRELSEKHDTLSMESLGTLQTRERFVSAGTDEFSSDPWKYGRL